MLNRVDRKRPSAVLEDRLEIDNSVDLDSSALSYLQLGAIHAERNQHNEKKTLLSPQNLRFKPKSIQTFDGIVKQENTVPFYNDKYQQFDNSPNKSKNQREITMSSSPSKSKLDSGSTSLLGSASNGHEVEDIIHLKILVPSVAAGAIIGKGGETIADAQLKSGAKVKMSKSNDFYPGTNERVCLITGSIESVSILLDFIMEKIRHKPDPNAKPAIDFDNKVSAEREKQVKVIIPNSTAGMIIGKGGGFIKQLKDDSGAFIQLSQKSKDSTLQERVVTVIGDPESNRKAMAMIVDKILEDPQSGSCLNISYSDVQGLVANFNPTGSPYANNDNNSEIRPGSSATSNGGKLAHQRNTTAGATSPSSQNTTSSLPSNDSDTVPNPFVLPLQGGGSLQLRFNINTTRPPTDPALMSQYLEHIKGTLRSSGYYSDLVVDDIAQAINVLSSHGILVVNLISPTPVTTNGSPNHSHLPHQQQQHHPPLHQHMGSSSTSCPNGIVYRSSATQVPPLTNTLMASPDPHSQLPNQIIGSAAAASINDAIMNNRQNQHQIQQPFQTPQPPRNNQQTHQQAPHHPTLFATSNSASLTNTAGGQGQIEAHQMGNFGLVHSGNHSNHTPLGGGGSPYNGTRQPTSYWTPGSPNAVAGSGIPQNSISVSEGAPNGVGANDVHSNVTARMVANSVAAAVAHQQQGGLLSLDSSNTSNVNLSPAVPSAGSNTATGMSKCRQCHMVN